MKAFLSILYISLLTLACQQEQLPNIILIMADDQGWGDVGYMTSTLEDPHLMLWPKMGLFLNVSIQQVRCVLLLEPVS